MRLANHILLWASLAVLTPLTLLSLSATLYSEWRYDQDTQREAQAALSNIISAVDRRLVFDREVISALALTPPVQDFLPVLERSLQGEIHPEYFERYSRLTDFLTGLQNALPSISAIYMLDRTATPVLGVQLGAGRLPGENTPELGESMRRQLSAVLAGLRANELSHVDIPSLHGHSKANALYDSVMPLSVSKKHLGYLIAVASNENLDHLIDTISRPSHTQLMIAENNNEDPQQEARILYSDAKAIRFNSQDRGDAVTRFADSFWQVAIQNPLSGIHHADNGSLYYYQAYPAFPNHFSSWIFSLHTTQTELSSPFARIRWTILAVTLLTAGIILLLARFGARKIAAPLLAMSQQLRNFSNNKQTIPMLVKAPDEVRELHGAVQAMADDLRTTEEQRDQAQKALLQQAKLATIGHLAAGISHELNNPLNNILSLGKLAQRELHSNPDAAHEDIESLREEAIRASGIINSILDYSRQRAPTLQSFNAKPWLQRCCKLLGPQAKQAQVAINSTVNAQSVPETSQPTIYGDANQLQQVLINLLVNAIQASPDNSQIEVTIRIEERHWQCCVADHGSGIQADQLALVTEPFFTTKAAGVGHGLGLSVSLGIIEAHGGTLVLENLPQSESKFESKQASILGLQACFTIPTPATHA